MFRSAEEGRTRLIPRSSPLHDNRCGGADRARGSRRCAVRRTPGRCDRLKRGTLRSRASRGRASGGRSMAVGGWCDSKSDEARDRLRAHRCLDEAQEAARCTRAKPLGVPDRLRAAALPRRGSRQGIAPTRRSGTRFPTGCERSIASTRLTRASRRTRRSGTRFRTALAERSIASTRFTQGIAPHEAKPHEVPDHLRAAALPDEVHEGIAPHEAKPCEALDDCERSVAE